MTNPDTLALQATYIREGLDPALVYSPPGTPEIAERIRVAFLGDRDGLAPSKTVVTQDDAARRVVLHDAILVEVTRSDGALASLARHIDPQQHTGGPPHRVDTHGDRGHWDDHTHAANGHPESAASFAMGLASSATTYVVGRPDLDAIAAIAVIEILDGVTDPEDRRDLVTTIAPRVELIRATDCFARGPWSPYPLDAEHLWPPAAGAVQDTAALAPIASICSPMGADPVFSLAERVVLVADWLLHGEHGLVADARHRIEAARAAMIARHDGMITVRGSVAAVVSNEPGALSIGYAHAPIVVAYAPAFRWPNGETAAKATIASWDATYLDHAALRERLGDGWGGPRDGSITGSPMGRGAPPIDWILKKVLALAPTAAALIESAAGWSPPERGCCGEWDTGSGEHGPECEMAPPSEAT